MATKDPPSASHEPGKHWTTSQQKSASKPNGPGWEDAWPAIWRTQPLLPAAARTSHRARTPAGRLLPRARLRTSWPSEVSHGDAEPDSWRYGRHTVWTADVSLWATGAGWLQPAEPGLLWSARPPTSPWPAAAAPICWSTPGQLWTSLFPAGPPFTVFWPTWAARTPLPTIPRSPWSFSRSASL